MDESVFKAYDLRGRYPDQLDEATARAVGSAFAEVAGAPRVVVARDMRLSGPALAGAFAQGVRGVGVEVLDLGLASTDLLYFASGHLDAPGAMFTASHNPAADNGVKLCLAGARPVGVDTGLADVRAAARRYYEHPATGDAPATEVDLWVEWVTHVHSFIDLTELRDLKVVADVANGMGALIVPRVFEGLPLVARRPLRRPRRDLPQPPGRPAQPGQPGRPAAPRPRDRRRHRPGLRRRRRPGLHRRRARRAGLGVGDDRAGGRGHARAPPRRDGPLQRHLL